MKCAESGATCVVSMCSTRAEREPKIGCYKEDEADAICSETARKGRKISDAPGSDDSAYILVNVGIFIFSFLPAFAIACHLLVDVRNEPGHEREPPEVAVAVVLRHEHGLEAKNS